MPIFTVIYSITETDDYRSPTRVLGTVQYDMGRSAQSLIYYCPSCGNVWGRMELYRELPSGPEPTTWAGYPRNCHGCGDGRLFDEPPFPQYINGLPAELMCYELMCFDPDKHQQQQSQHQQQPMENWP